MLDTFVSMHQAPNIPFWKDNAEYWLQHLNSNEQGLDETTAHELWLKKNNSRRHESALLKDMKLLLRQFKSPLMLLLIGAVILSAFLGDISDVFIILFIVLSTGIMSFFQERNAGRVVEQLESMISLKSTVLRNGKEQEVDSEKVVEGDILLFKAGDMIPADCLLIASNELYANESSLTGESFPVRKEKGALPEKTELSKRRNCLWEGTSIVSGNARAIAIHTGSDTIFGSIAQSTTQTLETGFEKGIKDFGFFLMKITLLLAVFILIVNLLHHKNIMESSLFALALAVGMAPELLPAITTIAMSAGARRMLEKKVIVKKLSSIQNLGEINLLCTDKTGTITEGAIKVHDIINTEGQTDEFVKTVSYWNAQFETGYANPIDEAIKNSGIQPLFQATKLGEIPYDFIRKKLSILLHSNNENILISKGAFNEMLKVCTKIRLANGQEEGLEAHVDLLQQSYERFGLNGLRCIAVTYTKTDKETIGKDDECALVFAGFILLQDPIKEGIQETIQSLRDLQVGLKIITGDNRNVARSIALQLGIEQPNILTGSDLMNTSTEALTLLAKDTHIFAEVEPQQKEQIINTLRKSFTVAYMGDGINDLSAIHAADVGISVDNAVDVAREAADFVLLEKSLHVITDGVKEGRKTFANTLKYIFINTGSTFGNMFSVAFASLLLPFLPMLPKQILLTNFITDFPYLAVASDNVDEQQTAQPGKWDMKLIRNYMVLFGIHSSVFDVLTFLTLLFVLKVKEAPFQTGWFIESVLTELFILFIIRTRNNFFKSRPGKHLLWLSVLGLALTVSFPYLPFAQELGFVALPLKSLGLMMLIVACYIITADWLKVWFFRRYR
jgi:Mg2+-importing ATPase